MTCRPKKKIATWKITGGPASCGRSRASISSTRQNSASMAQGSRVLRLKRVIPTYFKRADFPNGIFRTFYCDLRPCMNEELSPPSPRESGSNATRQNSLQRIDLSSALSIPRISSFGKPLGFSSLARWRPLGARKLPLGYLLSAKIAIH